MNPVWEAEIAGLEKLAAAIDGAAFTAFLIAAGDRRPHLQVTSRAAAMNVYAEAGWYWWPWATRIGEASDPAAAAQAVIAALTGYDGSDWPHHDGLKWPHCGAVVAGGLVVSA